MTLKLKRTPGLYLVGFMASGKTTIGKALSEQLGWPFTDVDAAIESREGMTVSQIFAERGEGAFRQLETDVLRAQIVGIEAGLPCVVALGGGAFIQPQNMEMITNNGVSLWLDCPIETIRRRLGDDTTRPLAANRNGLGDLFVDRRPLYAKADFRIEIDTDETLEIVRRILGLPIF